MLQLEEIHTAIVPGMEGYTCTGLCALKRCKGTHVPDSVPSKTQPLKCDPFPFFFRIFFLYQFSLHSSLQQLQMTELLEMLQRFTVLSDGAQFLKL